METLDRIIEKYCNELKETVKPEDLELAVIKKVMHHVNRHGLHALLKPNTKQYTAHKVRRIINK